jgi:CBS domain-containing protein
MTTIRQLLDQKGRNTWSVRPDVTVSDAVAEMANRNVGSLVVMDGAAFVGIVTERHLLRNAALPVATLVRDIMETRVLVARPEHSVEQCMALMTEKRVRHLPVLEGGSDLIGIISIGDLVKSIIGDQKFVIDQMEHYIHGHRW